MMEFRDIQLAKPFAPRLCPMLLFWVLTRHVFSLLHDSSGHFGQDLSHDEQIMQCEFHVYDIIWRLI